MCVQSDVERAENYEGFKKGLDSDYNISRAEMAASVDVTARVGDRVILSLLSKTNDMKQSGENEGIVTKAVHAELKARNIKLTDEEWTTFTLRQKVHAIRADEFKELRQTRDSVNKAEDVSDVEPKSDEMIAFLSEKQDELLVAKEK